MQATVFEHSAPLVAGTSRHFTHRENQSFVPPSDSNNKRAYTAVHVHCMDGSAWRGEKDKKLKNNKCVHDTGAEIVKKERKRICKLVAARR